jgi:hypothetical protein
LLDMEDTDDKEEFRLTITAKVASSFLTR